MEIANETINSSNHELIGTVNRVIFRNQDNGFSVLSFDSSQGHIIVTGQFPVIDQGEYARLIGNYCDHKTYGRQFQAIRKVPHNTKQGIIRYLASRHINGIGAKTAAKIVDHFGLKTLEIMDATPERLQEVPTIGKKKLKALTKNWEQQRTHRMLELFLLSNDLSPRLALKIIERYGDKTVVVLSKTPYRLAEEISGIGFLSADNFAKSIGIALDSNERLSAAILHCLLKAEDQGHCYLHLDELYNELATVTQLTQEQIQPRGPDCLVRLNRKNLIHIDSDHPDQPKIYQSELYYCEKMVAQHIRGLLARPLEISPSKLETWLKHYSQSLATLLSQAQTEAVRAAVSHRVFVLTGGPGVGKSTTANAIIKLLSALGRDVALAAPTGRAAQRLTSLTGEEAKTIHRLLEWSAQDGQFTRHSQKPLTAGAIIIDEASMLDLRLATALLQAVPPTSQIIFIGDIDQLPSVGAGNVLADLINSGVVPFVRLTEVFRQAAESDIIANAHTINQGLLPQFANTLASDCRFIVAPSPESGVHTIKRLVSEILPQKTSYDPIRDVQILTPMKKSDLGTDNLNKELQSLLNPAKDAREFRNFGEVLRPGDKVIQTSNNYDLNVFNGDIGWVLDAGIDDGKVIVNFADRTVSFASEQAKDLKLAYAITIHKSQGSEFPVIIIPVSTQHYVMLQRNLIYTALTRAKKLAIFVGTARALNQAVRTETSSSRHTSLAQFISGETRNGP